MSRKEIKTRLTSGWKTTILGSVLIIAAIISIFVSGITWVDAIVPITLGLGFLFSKDEWVNKITK